MKKQLTVRIDSEILDKMRDLIYWNQDMSLNSFVESIIEATVNQFDDIQKRPSQKLRPGRKLS